MKKIVCTLLAVSMLFCFAACSEKPFADNDGASGASQHDGYAWPDNALFGDVPALSEYTDGYKESKNDNGYVYEFSLDEMSYEAFRAYIAELEAAGFTIYDPTGFGLANTQERLPETLAEDVYNASWAGNRRGLYVSAFWFGDEYYEKNDLYADHNVRLTFYTYNAFDSVK